MATPRMAEPLRESQHLAPLLAVERLGVLTDVDGTISSIAVRPDAAVVSPVARTALASLAEHLPLVGALSGRTLFDLRRMIDLPDLLYVGSHGLTAWYHGVDEMGEEARPYLPRVQRARAELDHLRSITGVRIEDKGISLAIHYREADNPEAAHAAILAAIGGSPAAQQFDIRQAIMVIELFPRIPVNKGTAVREVVSRFRLDALIFFGDDLTDVDAMYAATALREQHNVLIATVGVHHAETPELISEASDYCVDGVAGVEHALEWLAVAVKERAAAEDGGAATRP